MDLLSIRQQFVQVSGRYDLVVDTTDWVDAGANFYINAGQRYLDQLIKGFGQAVAYKRLQAGIIGCSFQNCRAVQEVWVQNKTDKARWKLRQYSREELLTYYTGFFNELEQGTPLFYYLPANRIYPDRLTINEIESYIGLLDVRPSAGVKIYNGIIVLPPPDGEVVIEIHGLFFTPTLIEDTDETYWSNAYPTLLLWAALLELEVTYRNTEGAKDWKAAIDDRIRLIDMDSVEQDIAGVSQMEG